MRLIVSALAAGAVLLFATAADAADKGPYRTPSMADPPAVPASAQMDSRFDGAYVGVAIGYGSQVFDGGGVSLADQPFFPAGFIGAGRVVNGWYYGAEGGIMWANAKVSIGDSDFKVSGKNDYLADLRLRIGPQMGPVLLYATGGLAMTNARLSATDGVNSASKSETEFGFVAGGGLEYAMTENVHLRGEVLYYGFPTQSFSDVDLGKISLDQSATLARVGVSFKF